MEEGGLGFDGCRLVQEDEGLTFGISTGSGHLSSRGLESLLETALLAHVLFIIPNMWYLSHVVLRLKLPSPTVGPEAIAFDYTGAGPYASVADGRVLKWLDASAGFVDFAFISPSRSKKLCDGSTDPALEPTCGRPLGLGFNYRTVDLYIADAYHGLNVVGPKDGRIIQLATAAEGVPFLFLNAVDVDQETGIVYFTDASARFQRREFMLAVQTGDMTGRLMKYDPRTQEVTVLLRGLGGAGGVTISKDGSFILVTEFVTNRIQRFWLKGPKANTSELFLKPPGTPDNIKRNVRGEFWVAVNIGAGTAVLPSGLRLSEEGKVLQVVAFGTGDIPKTISEVQEYYRALYIGSLALPFVGVYRS
uniref:Strictosidine synthase conserved region domain-containing protein n=1 Tax=Vitis vinifera TaxID=29760 RepID=A5AHV3_VITVI|nr:hypothetical protein VITISV_044021 [Vitis vinifera]